MMDSNDLLTLRRDIELAKLRDLLWQAYRAGASTPALTNDDLRRFFEEWAGFSDADPWDRGEWA